MNALYSLWGWRSTDAMLVSVSNTLIAWLVAAQKSVTFQCPQTNHMGHTPPVLAHICLALIIFCVPCMADYMMVNLSSLDKPLQPRTWPQCILSLSETVLPNVIVRYTACIDKVTLRGRKLQDLLNMVNIICHGKYMRFISFSWIALRHLRRCIDALQNQAGSNEIWICIYSIISLHLSVQ